MTRDVRTVDADASAIAAGRGRNCSYFTYPRTDVDETLRVTADVDGQTLTHPSKVAFSLQPLHARYCAHYICSTHVTVVDGG